MNLKQMLKEGRDLQAAAAGASSQTVEELEKRLDKGLHYLVDHYGFTTAKDQLAWEGAQEKWNKLAAEHDLKLGLPSGYTGDELRLVLSWLRCDDRSPEIWLDEKRRGHLSLCEDTGRFRLPCTLRLNDGTILSCKLKRDQYDDAETVWDVWDLINLVRIRRVFPGAMPVLPKPKEG